MAIVIRRAEVTFMGSFPVDMLRYDSCWPARGEDASNIERSFHVPQVECKVQLCKHAKKKDKAWTPARWKSFACSIKELESF